MDKTIKMAVSIDYKTLEGNFGKKFGKVGARPKVATLRKKICAMEKDFKAKMSLVNIEMTVRYG